MHGMGQRARDFEIWQAAQQIIAKYPGEPEIAACQLADAAWATGDKDKFEQWMHIAKAVRELVGARPPERPEGAP